MQLPCSLDLHIGKHSDDVIEHRIGACVDAGTLEVCVTQGIRGQTYQRRCPAHDATQHCGTAVCDAQCVSTIHGCHEGHIHTCQGCASPQVHTLVISLCTGGVDHASIDSHSTADVGGQARQCVGASHSTCESRGT